MIIKEGIMKTFENIYTQDQVICQNPNEIKIIDGIEYLIVYNTSPNRMFLMRKDSLRPIRQKLNKKRLTTN